MNLFEEYHIIQNRFKKDKLQKLIIKIILQDDSASRLCNDIYEVISVRIFPFFLKKKLND